MYRVPLCHAAGRGFNSRHHFPLSGPTDLRLFFNSLNQPIHTIIRLRQDMRTNSTACKPISQPNPIPNPAPSELPSKALEKNGDLAAFLCDGEKVAAAGKPMARISWWRL